MLDKINKKYDEMQQLYGDSSLDSIKYGGCINSPDICFIFMNPTKRSIASSKSWTGLKAPWIGTKEIWYLFNQISLLSDEIYDNIKSIKGKDWDNDFAEKVYDEIFINKCFITNLGKCTQSDARPLSDSVFEKYLDLLYEEISYVNPKIIITFGNQVSSVFLKEKISVGECRKKSFNLNIKNSVYKVYPVYYPVGNGKFNIEKSIEDLKYIIESK